MIHTAQEKSTGGDTGIAVLAWLLYILAVVTLVLGLIMGFNVINVPQVINSYGPLLGAVGGSPLMNLVTRGLQGVFINVGIVVIVGSIAGAIVMFASGLLLQRSQRLSHRVKRLEAQLSTLV